MRKIFLFLFAAVLSIGTAMAENIVVSDGQFVRSDGMWTISGTYGDYSVNVTLSETFDLANPTEVGPVMIDLFNDVLGEFAGGGEGDATATVTDNKMTLTVEYIDWLTEVTNNLEITAELPDPNAVVIDATYAIEMHNLEVDGKTLIASGKYKAGWEEKPFSVELTLENEPTVDGEYVVSNAIVASESWMGMVYYSFISGTLTRAYDEDLETTVYTGQVLVKDDYNMVTALELTLYYQAPQEITVILTDAEFEWDYGNLVLSKDDHRVSLGNYEYEFAYTGVINEELSYDELAVYEAPSGDYGYTSKVEMTVDADKKITLKATYPSETENALYHVTISGTLPTFTVTLECSLAGVTLTGAGEYVIGDRVFVNAIAPNAAWSFEQWTNQATGNRASNNATYDFAADKDYTLTANFIFQITEEDNTTALTNYNGTTQTVKVLRDFSKDKLYTIALPFAINDVASTALGAGTLVYEYNGLTKDANGDLVINFATVTSIAAGKPYLIIPAKNVWSSYSALKVENATISNTTTPISYSVDGTTVTMTPVMSAVASNNGAYWLAENTYLYNDATEVLGLRALFNISTRNGIAPRARVALGENEATGLENINATTTAVKTIENGQLIITIDGVKYNVQGVRL